MIYIENAGRGRVLFSRSTVNSDDMGQKIHFDGTTPENTSNGILGKNSPDNTRSATEAASMASATKRFAANLALRLLSQRSHTRRELSVKLQRRGLDGKTINQVVTECERLHYIDDEALARTYRKQMTEKGYGARYVQMAMKKKGFTDRDIETAFSEYDMEADERTAAQSTLERKAKTLNHLPDNLKKKQKLYRFLCSRGFSPSTVLGVLNTTLADS